MRTTLQTATKDAGGRRGRARPACPAVRGGRLAGATVAAILLVAGGLAGRPAGGQEARPELAAVTRSDDARIAAFRNPTADGLAAIFADELHYAHSNGLIDTKASFIEALTTGRTKYHAIDYEKREFTFPAPGIALMRGRVRIRAESATGPSDNVLSFLAVWRLEEGRWKFLAWQSCRLPPPAP